MRVRMKLQTGRKIWGQLVSYHDDKAICLDEFGCHVMVQVTDLQIMKWEYLDDLHVGARALGVDTLCQFCVWQDSCEVMPEVVVPDGNDVIAPVIHCTIFEENIDG